MKKVCCLGLLVGFMMVAALVSAEEVRQDLVVQTLNNLISPYSTADIRSALNEFKASSSSIGSSERSISKPEGKGLVLSFYVGDSNPGGSVTVKKSLSSSGEADFIMAVLLAAANSKKLTKIATFEQPLDDQSDPVGFGKITVYDNNEGIAAVYNKLANGRWSMER